MNNSNQAKPVKVTNWFDLTIFTIFTLGVVAIGMPASLYLLKNGIKGFAEYKFKKLPSNYLKASSLGNYALETIFYGVFILTFSSWYLFIDNGGQLFNLIYEAKAFLGLYSVQ